MLCEYAGFTLHPSATRLRPRPPKLACEMHTKKHKETNVNTMGARSTSLRSFSTVVRQPIAWHEVAPASARAADWLRDGAFPF